MHTSEPPDPSKDNDHADSESKPDEHGAKLQDRHLLTVVVILAIVAAAVVGWRLFWDADDTRAVYYDPLTQFCAVDEETLIALGGEPVPNNAFWDGMHVIGEASILPGTYRSSSAGNCYWARLSGTSGAEQDIIDSNQASGGPQTVTILATDAAFTSMGCGEWHAVSE